MVRQAVHGAARCAGPDERAISELMGHGGDGRIEARPLPNVGYWHADGRIRRVLVVAPWIVAEDAWRSVESRLVGAALVAEAGGEPLGVLASLRKSDPMLARTGERAGAGRARPRWCCRGTTVTGAGCARSAR